MTFGTIIILYSSVYLVFHTYFVYPLLLKTLPKKKNLFQNNSEHKNSVAMVIAAYNEEKVIKQKLLSVLNNTPENLNLDIYIGSDGSTDKTNEIISGLSSKYKNIHLIHFPGRSGKAQVVNQIIKDLKQDVFILTDANVMFTRNTLEQLLFPFRDNSIGLVCSNIVKTAKSDNAVETIESNYISRENKIKKLESDIWGIVIGAEGGCYAIKRIYYNPIPLNFFMDDFFVTMNVLEQNKKVVFQENAVCLEDVPDNMQEEFKRKIRISIGNFQNLKRFYRLLFKFNPISFAFWSHKVLRWITPMLLLTMFLCLGRLSISINFYLFALILITSVAITSLILPDHKALRVFNYIKHFMGMNLALLIGFFRYVKGVKSSVWTPTERNN